MQISSDAHAFPQVPQFARSLWRSTHAPLHAVGGSVQVHVPLTQDCPAVQRSPQPPQFRAS
jgi:hypothetical protein